MIEEHLSENIIIFSVFVFFIAGFVKGCIGMGLPLVSLSLLTLYTSPRMAMTLIIIPTLVTNFLQFYRSENKLKSIKRYSPLLFSLFLFTYFSSLFSFSLMEETLSLTLGVIILTFVIYQRFNTLPEIGKNHEILVQSLFGGLIGVVAGITNVWAPTIGTLLLLKKVQKNHFIALTGLFIFVGSLALLISYGLNDKYDSQLVALSSGFLIPAAVGFILGEKVRVYISERIFYQTLMVFLFIVSINLIIKSSIFINL